MYHLNDPLPQFIVAYYVIMAGLLIALAAALLRPFYRPWPCERTCWFVGAFICFVLIDVMSAQTPYLCPDTRGAGTFAGVTWVIASIAFLMGLFPRPAIDPRTAHSKGADAPLGLACVLISTLWFSASITPREFGNNLSCKNNLKNIMLAHWNHYDTEMRFAAPSAGEPPHSWRVTLLPWLQQKPLFDRYQFNEAWDATGNHPVAKQ